MNRNDFLQYDWVYDETVDESDDYLNEPLPQDTGRANSRRTLLPMFLYDILKRSSSPSHKLTHEDLIAELDRFPYALSAERRAVGRALKTLELEEFGIHTSGNGAWYEHRDFAA